MEEKIIFEIPEPITKKFDGILNNNSNGQYFKKIGDKYYVTCKKISRSSEYFFLDFFYYDINGRCHRELQKIPFTYKNENSKKDNDIECITLTQNSSGGLDAQIEFINKYEIKDFIDVNYDIDDIIYDNFYFYAEKTEATQERESARKISKANITIKNYSGEDINQCCIFELDENNELIENEFMVYDLKKVDHKKIVGESNFNYNNDEYGKIKEIELNKNNAVGVCFYNNDKLVSKKIIHVTPRIGLVNETLNFDFDKNLFTKALNLKISIPSDIEIFPGFLISGARINGIEYNINDGNVTIPKPKDNSIRIEFFSRDGYLPKSEVFLFKITDQIVTLNFGKNLKLQKSVGAELRDTITINRKLLGIILIGLGCVFLGLIIGVTFAAIFSLIAPIIAIPVTIIGFVFSLLSFIFGSKSRTLGTNKCESKKIEDDPIYAISNETQVPETSILDSKHFSEEEDNEIPIMTTGNSGKNLYGD